MSGHPLCGTSIPGPRSPPFWGLFAQRSLTTNDVIDAYIGLKMQEVTRFRMTTHPVEFDMYYSL